MLKVLIDRLLQDGIEELLHVLSTSKKTKENTETHTSNVITEYTVNNLCGGKLFVFLPSCHSALESEPQMPGAIAPLAGVMVRIFFYEDQSDRELQRDANLI